MRCLKPVQNVVLYLLFLIRIRKGNKQIRRFPIQSVVVVEYKLLGTEVGLKIFHLRIDMVVQIPDVSGHTVEWQRFIPLDIDLKRLPRQSGHCLLFERRISKIPPGHHPQHHDDNPYSPVEGKMKSGIVCPADPVLMVVFLFDPDWFIPEQPVIRDRNKHDGHEITDTETNRQDRKSTRLNSSHVKISYAVFSLKKKNI